MDSHVIMTYIQMMIHYTRVATITVTDSYQIYCSRRDFRIFCNPLYRCPG